MCAGVYLHICLNTPCRSSTCGRKKSVGSPKNRVLDSWELPCSSWQLNPGTLEGYPVLLTAEPSLQTL